MNEHEREISIYICVYNASSTYFGLMKWIFFTGVDSYRCAVRNSNNCASILYAKIMAREKFIWISFHCLIKEIFELFMFVKLRHGRDSLEVRLLLKGNPTDKDDWFFAEDNVFRLPTHFHLCESIETWKLYLTTILIQWIYQQVELVEPHRRQHWEWLWWH